VSFLFFDFCKKVKERNGVVFSTTLHRSSKGNQVNIPEPGLGIFSLAATQLNLETPAGALGRVFFSF
jgi:hypothetical protein